jgi:hypothetical protein
MAWFLMPPISKARNLAADCRYVPIAAEPLGPTALPYFSVDAPVAEVLDEINGVSHSTVYSYKPALASVTHVERTRILRHSAPAELNRGNPMLQPDLVTLILMVFVAMLVISFWRQTLFLLLSAAAVTFCFGLYHLILLFQIG